MLTAVDQDGRVIDLTQDDGPSWDAVYIQKRRTVRCRECSHPAFGRVSAIGTRHFVHARDAAACSHTKRESEAHRQLKTAIARDARARGWQADIEALPSEGDHGGWRADVLITFDTGTRVAVEVQLSAIHPADALERTRRHSADGILTLWVSTRRQPGWARSVVWGHIDAGSLTLYDCLHVARGILYAPMFAHISEVIGGLASGLLTIHQAPSRHVRSQRHDPIATVAVPTADAGRPEAELLRREDERKREADADARLGIPRDPLFRRQHGLFPGALDETRRAHAEPLWLGIPPTPDRVGSSWRDALGNDGDTGGGAVIWAGSTESRLRVVAVVSPQAYRITSPVAQSWERLDVTIYVHSQQERDRVSSATGLPRSLFAVRVDPKRSSP